MWSHDGKYLYLQYYPAPDKAYRIVRLRMSHRKIEEIAELNTVGRRTAGTWGQWFGLAPDNEFDDMKTDAGRREVPFDKRGVVLSAVPRMRAANKKFRKPDDLVFANRFGKALDRQSSPSIVHHRTS